MKKFLKEDLEQLYEDAKFKRIPGASPKAHFYNAEGKEVEKMDIDKFTRLVLADNTWLWNTIYFEKFSEISLLFSGPN